MGGKVERRRRDGEGDRGTLGERVRSQSHLNHDSHLKKHGGEARGKMMEQRARVLTEILLKQDSSTFEQATMTCNNILLSEHQRKFAHSLITVP